MATKRLETHQRRGQQQAQFLARLEGLFHKSDVDNSGSLSLEVQPASYPGCPVRSTTTLLAC